MSKSNQPNSSKSSLLRRLPHLVEGRTHSIANHMIAKKDYLGSKKNKDQTIIKVSSQNSISVNKDLMDLEHKSIEIGEGSAGIYQGLSDGFANMSIQGKTSSAQSHLAQSHSAPQTAPFPSSFNPTKTNDPNKTIGS